MGGIVVVCNTDWHSRYNLPAERLKLIGRTAGRISKKSMKKPRHCTMLYNDGVISVFWFYTISTSPQGVGAYPGVDYGSKEDLEKTDIWGNIGLYGTSEIPDLQDPYSDTKFHMNKLLWKFVFRSRWAVPITIQHTL